MDSFKTLKTMIFAAYTLISCAMALPLATGGPATGTVIGQEWEDMLGTVLIIQQEASEEYCTRVHKILFGVDELSLPMDRCQKFAENNVRMTTLREPTALNESQPVDKNVMQSIYKDLHYYERVLYDIAKNGTQSLERVGCMVDDISKTGPCALYCYSHRKPEQELYCHMLEQVAPRLWNAIDHMTVELNMSDWTSPPYVPLGLSAETPIAIITYYSVLADHYLTLQLQIAKQAAPKYVG